MYSWEIEDFIKASVIYITKLKFFYMFKAAYNKTITPKNVKSSFKGASLVPFNPKVVILRLNVKL